MEKLSIIVPVYNSYKYLRECLESLINQSYKNLEIIIVNDASPYEEDDIMCKEYAAKDKRINYIKHNENKFQGGARNTGIKVATGKYITFLDGDDFLCDNTIYETILKEFYNNKDKLDVVGYNVKLYIHEKNKYIKSKICNSDRRYKKTGILTINYFTDVVWNKVFISSDIKDNQLYFKEKSLYEDTDFMIRYIATINPNYKFLKQYGYAFRQRNDSISHTRYTEKSRIISLYNIYKDLLNINRIDIKMYNDYFLKSIMDYCKNTQTLAEEFTELKELIRMIFKSINITRTSFNLFVLFIDDSDAKKHYINMIEKYKKFNYKPVIPNTVIYKIKREVIRILKQFKIINN